MSDEERAVADERDELREALWQAQWTVEFLHNCLTRPSNGRLDGGFSYGHPEQTLQRLEKWRKLAPPPPLCFHSRTEAGCEACRVRNEHARQRAERAKRANSPADDREPRADDGGGRGR